MKIESSSLNIDALSNEIKNRIRDKQERLGLISSIDGGQLITIMLDPRKGSAECLESKISGNSYQALTKSIPQAHWFERINWDLFGIIADGHPRLKAVRVHECYPSDFFPLRTIPFDGEKKSRDTVYRYVDVDGEGVYNVPVGPIHAGVIEPGHFRLACLGETIVNLELKLGYLHRGVEKRVTEVPWRKARFVAEAAATDTTVANALAHSIAIESLFELEVSPKAQSLRTVALEIERLAMHIIDLSGMAGDLGFVGVAAALSKLRGVALGFGQTLTGGRFLRGYVLPGGVFNTPLEKLSKIKAGCSKLRESLKTVLNFVEENHRAIERLSHTGVISRAMAEDFGMVGLMARASGISYDARKHFSQGTFPGRDFPLASESTGCMMARTNIRIKEVYSSLTIIESELENLPEGDLLIKLPNQLPSDTIGAGVVEAFRGELIHLLITGADGSIKRCVIKDPSCNNWAGSSIANRGNLIADFPLTNKSMALSYGGNDL